MQYDSIEYVRPMFVLLIDPDNLNEIAKEKSKVGKYSKLIFFSF